MPLLSHGRRRTIQAYGLRKQVVAKVHAKLRAAKERGVQVKHLPRLLEQLRPAYWQRLTYYPMGYNDAPPPPPPRNISRNAE